MNWYLEALGNYFGFKGRARAKEFWMFFLFHCIITVVLFAIDMVIMIKMKFEVAPQIFSHLYSLVIMIPGIAVMIRRLHDVGKSGHLILLAFIPLANLYLLYLLILDSEPYSNKYGPNPKEGR